MSTSSLGLPSETAAVLEAFVSDAAHALGSSLRAIVLHGSAAEGRLRPTSDVNVILVLRRLERDALDRLREPLRADHAAIRLSAMFLLEGELPAAAAAFATKFEDVLRRRRVLFGDDPFAGLCIPREAALARLRQVLLNLAIRLRSQYALRSLREEQASLAVADAAGPLRAAAASLIALEGREPLPPREALAELAAAVLGKDARVLLARVSQARETRRLPGDVAGETLLQLAELARRLHERAQALA